jgi:hypothetical protein
MDRILLEDKRNKTKRKRRIIKIKQKIEKKNRTFRQLNKKDKCTIKKKIHKISEKNR